MIIMIIISYIYIYIYPEPALLTAGDLVQSRPEAVRCNAIMIIIMIIITVVH